MISGSEKTKPNKANLFVQRSADCVRMMHEMENQIVDNLSP